MSGKNASPDATATPSKESLSRPGRSRREPAHQTDTEAQTKKEPTFSGLSKILWDASSIEEARELAAARRGGRDE